MTTASTPSTSTARWVKQRPLRATHGLEDWEDSPWMACKAWNRLQI